MSINKINKHIKILNNQKFEILSSCKIFTKLITNSFLKKKKLLIAGNGGSASDAQHISAELQIRFKKIKRPALPAISLTTDTSLITACGNDLSFDKIFSRQIEGLGNQGDIFFGISTSGNSKNIVNAFKTAKTKKMHTLGLFGNKGGECKKFCDKSFIVNSKETALIQEIHVIFYHMLCDQIEDRFLI